MPSQDGYNGRKSSDHGLQAGEQPRSFVDDLKENIHDAVVRRGNKVFVGTYTHDDDTKYNVFVTVEESK